MSFINRPLFSVADNRQLLGRNTERQQIVHCCLGTVFTESKVVLVRASLVTMALKLDFALVLLEKIFGVIVKDVSVCLP